VFLENCALRQYGNLFSFSTKGLFCKRLVLAEHFEPLQKVFIFIDHGFKAILAIFLFGVVGIIVLPIWAVFFD